MNDSPLIPVQVGACRCPDTPHSDGDVVYLYPKLGMEAGIAVQSAIFLSADGAPRLQAVYGALIDHNIADWTISNGTGEKLPINPANIRGALPWTEGGSDVANKLLEMHAEVFTKSPLARPAPKNSRPTGKSSKRGLTSVTSTSASRAS